MPDPLCLFVGSPSPPSTAPKPGKHLEFHSLLIKDQTQRGTQIQLQVAIQSKWPGELSYYNSCSYCHLMSILSSDKVIRRSFIQLTQQVCDVDVFTQKPILTGSHKETQTTFRKGKGSIQKHCQRHNRPKALSMLIHSTPLVQNRSFNKLWNLGETSAWFCLAKGEKYKSM